MPRVGEVVVESREACEAKCAAFYGRVHRKASATPYETACEW